MKCPCGGKSYEECCAPYITGKAKPEVAEALMRARYTAYATGNIEYIKETTIPEEQEEFDLATAQAWSRESEWLGFELIKSEGGAADQDEAKIEFVASYKVKGKRENHHEISTFKKIDGEWFFADGEIIVQVVNRQPKVGRNDPCTCGSGKKFKKCCGNS